MNSEKQKATIDHWRVITMGCLIGKITDHNRQEEFEAPLQVTSPLVRPPRSQFHEMKEGDEVETENTIYILGVPCNM